MKHSRKSPPSYVIQPSNGLLTTNALITSNWISRSRPTLHTALSPAKNASFNTYLAAPRGGCLMSFQQSSTSLPSASPSEPFERRLRAYRMLPRSRLLGTNPVSVSALAIKRQIDFPDGREFRSAGPHIHHPGACCSRRAAGVTHSHAALRHELSSHSWMSAPRIG